jgi:cytochrome c oxidase subunit 2
MGFVEKSGRAAAVFAFSLLVLGVWVGGAAAGEPKPWQIGFQPAASPTAEEIHALNDILLVIIVAIVAFVLGLLMYVMWRFSEKRNPTPTKTTHNTLLEVAWTAIPVIILVIIAIPSFKLLYFADRVEEADMTIKAIGVQWYWTYEYPDHGNFTFDAIMVPDDELQEGQKRLLDTDTAVVVPVETNIRLLVAAEEVIHGFAVPALGLKLDGVPGRVNETWMRINQEGTYYGQCSELCGTGHSYMPIKIVAVSKAEFDTWVETAREEFARVDAPASNVLLAEAPATGEAATE